MKKVCFMINGRKICVEIPVAINWREYIFGPPPPPDPPFLIDSRINVKVLRNIQVLAALDMVAGALTGRAKTQVKQVLKELAHSEKLPSDVSLTF